MDFLLERWRRTKEEEYERNLSMLSVSESSLLSRSLGSLSPLSLQYGSSISLLSLSCGHPHHRSASYRPSTTVDYPISHGNHRSIRHLLEKHGKEVVVVLLNDKRTGQPQVFSHSLVIAHVGGASLWDSARDQFLKMSRSPYRKVVSTMVNHDVMTHEPCENSTPKIMEGNFVSFVHYCPKRGVDSAL